MKNFLERTDNSLSLFWLKQRLAAAGLNPLLAFALPEDAALMMASGQPVPPPAPEFELITPLDTDKFPATLVGYAYEILHGNASGRSTSYAGSVYAKPWLSQPAVKLGRAYSEIGNSVSSFDDYRYGDIAIGYSADSATKGNQALNVWISDSLITAAEANVIIESADAHILYELFDSDGSEWKAVVRLADGATGYRNEITNVFMQPKGGIPYVGQNLLTADVIENNLIGAYINYAPKYTLRVSSSSISVWLPVETDKNYLLEWDTTDVGVVGEIYHFGFCDDLTPQYDDSNQLSPDRVASQSDPNGTPQNYPRYIANAGAKYLIVQIDSVRYDVGIQHLSVREIYGYDPSSDLLTMLTGDNGGANSAAMLNTLGGR